MNSRNSAHIVYVFRNEGQIRAKRNTFDTTGKAEGLINNLHVKLFRSLQHCVSDRYNDLGGERLNKTAIFCLISQL